MDETEAVLCRQRCQPAVVRHQRCRQYGAGQPAQFPEEGPQEELRPPEHLHRSHSSPQSQRPPQCIVHETAFEFSIESVSRPVRHIETMSHNQQVRRRVWWKAPPHRAPPERMPDVPIAPKQVDSYLLQDAHSFLALHTRTQRQASLPRPSPSLPHQPASPRAERIAKARASAATATTGGAKVAARLNNGHVPASDGTSSSNDSKPGKFRQMVSVAMNLAAVRAKAAQAAAERERMAKAVEMLARAEAAGLGSHT